ncbi:MAG: 4Fe-4S ferredoxin, partial [Roseinatronobacter sp.]|nr:4Fe-4S ferredoxin [Roseinatronobacter sp.]
MLDNTPNLHDEAARQFQICNSCRYCEGYCDVFPQLFALPEMTAAHATHLANLCHNCRGCYYACQYAPPHEFDLNLPAVLAELRQDTYENYARPQALARVFHSHGVAVAAALIAGFAALFAALAALKPESGEGFYAYLGHNAMVAIFAPAFLLPLLGLALSLRSYWRDIGGGWIGW